MGEIWIDVEEEGGAVVGPGPIISASDWRHAPKLDAAGRFSFSMPAEDPRALLLERKRTVICRTIRGGQVVELGAGIINRVDARVGDPSTLQVTGPDLLAELSRRTVGNLVICEQDWIGLDDPGVGTLSWFRVGADGYADPNIFIPQAHDGDLGTSEAVYMTRAPAGFPEQQDYIYAAHDARYDTLAWFLLPGGRVNERNSRLRGQYFNGEYWDDVEITEDTTQVDGRSLAQDGQVRFIRPANWARYTAAHGAGNWFFTRWFPTGSNERIGDAGEGYLDLANVQVYADVPTTLGIQQIMEHAPPGWTLDPVAAETVWPKYLEFSGQSVLTALLELAEQGGQEANQAIREHFRLGTGRVLEWMGTDLDDSGIRAVRASGTDEVHPEIVRIEDLSEVHDASEVVTRIYPTTGDGITLALTNRTAPDGYTFSRAGNYIQHDEGYARYGLIEVERTFSELSMQQADSFTTHPSFAANQLFDRTVEVLRTHGLEQAFYRLRVAQFPRLLRPGETIRVVYHLFTEGEHVIDIDDELVILEATIQVSQGRLTTIGLDVSTADRWAKTDAGVVTDLVRERRRSSANVRNTIIRTETTAPAPNMTSVVRGFATVIGDGAERVFIVEHGLRTGSIQVEVWDLEA